MTRISNTISFIVVIQFLWFNQFKSSYTACVGFMVVSLCSHVIFFQLTTWPDWQRRFVAVRQNWYQGA